MYVQVTVPAIPSHLFENAHHISPSKNTIRRSAIHHHYHKRGHQKRRLEQETKTPRTPIPSQQMHTGYPDSL